MVAACAVPTVIEKAAPAAAPQASVTVRLNGNAPTVEGVPAMKKLWFRACCSVRPGGRLPLTTRKTGTGEKGVLHPGELVRV